MQPPDVEIRAYRPGDEQRILDTFNLVFRAACGPGFVDRTLEHWRWQSLQNPAGHRIVVAVAADGTVAAQFAGVPLLADTPWGEQRFVHCVDSMTHPAWRVGQPMALFARTGTRFGAQCVERGEALCFGYPVDVAFRAGREHLRYVPMATIDYLVRDRDRPTPPLPAGWHVERVATLPAEIDELWCRVRATTTCSVRRDRRYLQWRYVDHPERSAYELWAARAGDRLGGLAVLRARAGLLPDATAIVDWVVPADDAAADALLVAAARRQHEVGARRLFAVLPPWSAAWRAFVRHDFVPTPSRTWLARRLVHDIHAAAITPAFLATSWWYTLGDSDLA
jgi:hypothetical protein